MIPVYEDIQAPVLQIKKRINTTRKAEKTKKKKYKAQNLHSL